ncbi:hypothetical protein ASU33_15005 [Solirubrum puertoriconensis]|uniref:Uncharacterized protein n=2 Tax=Solirubrum puertoriconensis TaxID=1751427 RepID=A0A9X0HKP4_SOLP1|nr:hypothetical protein ASU33_15005 [Solirubrum puertoriconensis]
MLIWFQLLAGLLVAALYAQLDLTLSRYSLAIRRLFWPLLSALFMSIPLMLPIWSVQSYITKQRANLIIDRLESFRGKHGHYPNSLALLVPAYLPKVPSTAEGLIKGRPFDYRVTQDSSLPAQQKTPAANFSLGYYNGSMVTVTYNSTTNKWHSED